jgi:PAS domain S-box-containing protein
VEYLSTVARDISDRKRSEESVREAEEKYRSIFENAVEGIFQSTLSGDFITANPAMARILGYDSPFELLDSTRDKERQLHVEPERRTEMIRLLELNGKVDGMEISLFRRDGSKILVSESARAIRGINGSILYYQGIIEDISERKDLEQQLLQAQKMEAVGRLAGGVAHDFNNLLTAIIGYGQLSLANVAVDDPTHTNIQEIIAAGERAASLTRQLLTFSRKQVLQPAIVDLNRIISETRRMLQRLIGEDISIVNLTDPLLGSVKADPGQIEQVILNLAINARDAMPHGGKLTIETYNAEVDEAYACSHPGVAPGPYVVLTVTDTGCGMNADVKSHIFEPFFTTKEAGKGTGLGLSTVYGIVKQSSGDVVVFSEPGMGTSFKIYLPRLVDSSVPEVRSREDDSIPRGSETILLTEDEQIVREVASHVLRELGYTVLETSGGKEALAVAGQYIGKIDLLLTDVVMPGMNGNELAGRIKAMRPDTKVLFCSGYTDDAIVHLGVLDRTIAFLQKPFAPSSLARRVREVLDE